VKAPQGVLIILNVTDRPVGRNGSLVEVLLFQPQQDARPEIQAKYDLASLGEVESIHGPYCDPPRWMVSYKGIVLAKKGDQIKPKDSISGSRSSISGASDQTVKQTP
jgi:hypothetical protein